MRGKTARFGVIKYPPGGWSVRKIRLTIEYDGTDYGGWQVQPNAVTIQEVIENALRRITGETVRLAAAGRTDAGVHALGQVAAFSTRSSHSPGVFLKALNSMLPRDIRISEAIEVEEGFHPRYDARSKRYIYLIDLSEVQSPFLYRYAWHIPFSLDISAMKEASRCLLGRHDFSSFRGSGCGAKSSVRTIISFGVGVIENPEILGLSFRGRLLRIGVEGDAFLRHMVRNIVGTLVEIGRGKIAPGEMSGIMEGADRRLAGPTAPARGLFLERIDY